MFTNDVRIAINHRLIDTMGLLAYLSAPVIPRCPRYPGDRSGDYSSVDEIPVSTGGTPFQQLVWQALRSIPLGTVVTYGELALQDWQSNILPCRRNDKFTQSSSERTALSSGGWYK